MRVVIEVKFDNRRVAETVYFSIIPENKTAKRVKINTFLQGKSIITEIEGEYITTTVADLLDSIHLAGRIISLLKQLESIE